MMMINLLPWRDRLRERRKRQYFAVLVLSAGFGLLMVLVIHVLMMVKINSQNDANAFLEQHIAELDQQVKEIKGLKDQKALLFARINIIKELQNTRPKIVHLFDSLVNVLPDSVYLTSVKREDQKVILVGRADSNTSVSKLMKNIEESSWLAAPILVEIKNEDKNTARGSYFTVMLRVDHETKPVLTNREGRSKLS